MRARRCIVLLGPGLLASLALSPVLATQASAAPAAAQASVALDSYVGQPQPDPNGPQAYKQGLAEGYVLGYKVGQQDAKAKNKQDPRRLSPYSRGTTELSKGRFDGFIRGYYRGVLVVNPFELSEGMSRAQTEREDEAQRQRDDEAQRQRERELENAPAEDPAEEPADTEEHEPANPPADVPANPPDEGHEQQ